MKPIPILRLPLVNVDRDENPNAQLLPEVHCDKELLPNPQLADELLRFKELSPNPQLLDPVLYAKGRSITVSGTSAPSKEGKIGDMNYRFAVINATQHKLWPVVKEVEVRYEDPLFDDGFYFHHRHRVIVPR